MSAGRLSPEQDFAALVSLGFVEVGDLLLHEDADGHVKHATVLPGGGVALADGSVHQAGVAALSAAVSDCRNGWKSWRHDATGRTLAELHIAARSLNV